MGNNCCECNNRIGIDDGNLGEKSKNKIQQIKEDKIQYTYKENINTNSINVNLTGNYDLQQTNNVTIQKDPDFQIPIKPPKVPHDIIPDNIINSRKKLKLIIIQSKYLCEGREFIINAGGLIGSRRNLKNGITIFGDYSVSNIYKNIFFLE